MQVGSGICILLRYFFDVLSIVEDPRLISESFRNANEEEPERDVDESIIAWVNSRTAFRFPRIISFIGKPIFLETNEEQPQG